jgi:hypothetical protein
VTDIERLSFNPPTTLRGTGRTISKIETRHALATLQLQSHAALTAQKIEALTRLGQAGVMGATILTQVADSCALSTPNASGDIARIRDAATVGITSIVMRAAWEL